MRYMASFTDQKSSPTDLEPNSGQKSSRPGFIWPLHGELSRKRGEAEIPPPAAQTQIRLAGLGINESGIFS